MRIHGVRSSLTIIALACGFVAVAPAQLQVTGDIICDNSFVLYTGDTQGTSYTFRGGGAFPVATAFDFTTTEPVLYIAAWSDDAVHQGLLHDLSLGGQPCWSDDPGWGVFATGQNLDADYPATQPSSAEIRAHVARAVAGGLWQPIVVGGQNDGTFPAGDAWLAVAPIPLTARWTWFDTGRQGGLDAPFRSGFNHDEYLIFRFKRDSPLPAEARTWSEIKRLYR